MRQNDSRVKNILNMLVVLCVFFFLGGILSIALNLGNVKALGEENIIQDGKWDEKLYVNYDMSDPLNLEKNSILSGDENTNKIENSEVTFIKNINSKSGSHNRGTDPLNKNNAICYIFKEPVNIKDYAYIEFSFFHEGENLELSFFSQNEKVLVKENSLLNIKVENNKPIYLDGQLFKDEKGYVKNITVLVNNISSSFPLYLEDVVLRSEGMNMLGASIRMVAPTGLGFGTSIDTKYYNNLEKQYGKENVSTGTLITRSDFIVNEEDLNISLDKKIDVKNRNWLKSSPLNKHLFRGSIVEIPKTHYLSSFTGRGYIKIHVNNKDLYIYANPCTRTIGDVAKSAYEDVNQNWTEEEKTILREYAGGGVVENNILKYNIVISQNPSVAEIEMSELLALNISKSVGCEVPKVVNENNVGNEKGIYIGDTVKRPKNLSIPKANEAYVLKKDDAGNIFIRGNSSKDIDYKFVYDRGTVYGVYDFLENYFGYRIVNVDYPTKEIIESYDTVNNLYLMDIEETSFVPSIDLRAYSAYNINFNNTVQPYASFLRHNTNLAKNGGGFDYNSEKYGYTHQLEYYAPPFHNSYDTLKAGVKLYNEQNPGFNLTADQFSYIMPQMNLPEVCMTKSVNVNGRTITSLDIITLALKEKIRESYTWTAPEHYYVYEQEDSHIGEECQCPECKKEREKYGGASGQLIQFMNNVIKNLEQDTEFILSCPDFKLITFAYMYTKDAPTNPSIKADEKLIIRLALKGDDFYGVNTNQNIETKTRLENWKPHLGGGIMFWIYDSDFQNYAGYYPTINRSIADNVKTVIDNNGKYLLVNASGALNDWDSEMRLYIYSKMMYNFDEQKYLEDANGYVREIATEYIKAYFGEKNIQGVLKIIDDYQSLYEAQGGINNLKVNGKINKKPLLNGLKNIEKDINKLIDAETNESYKKRLKLIKISVLADLYDAGENGLTKRRQLKDLANECGFTQWSEGLTVEQKLG